MALPKKKDKFARVVGSNPAVSATGRQFVARLKVVFPLTIRRYFADKRTPVNHQYSVYHCWVLSAPAYYLELMGALL